MNDQLDPNPGDVPRCEIFLNGKVRCRLSVSHRYVGQRTPHQYDPAEVRAAFPKWDEKTVQSFSGVAQQSNPGDEPELKPCPNPQCRSTNVAFNSVVGHPMTQPRVYCCDCLLTGPREPTENAGVRWNGLTRTVRSGDSRDLLPLLQRVEGFIDTEGGEDESLLIEVREAITALEAVRDRADEVAPCGECARLQGRYEHYWKETVALRRDLAGANAELESLRSARTDRETVIRECAAKCNEVAAAFAAFDSGESHNKKDGALQCESAILSLITPAID